MQTFLPFADFKQSAQSLDMARLGKQRVETLQIMKALTNDTYGWQNHPAVNQWRGYEDALLAYQFATVQEWDARPRKNGKPGAKDTCLPQTMDILAEYLMGRGEYTVHVYEMPPWLGREDIHESHRSRLIAKDPLYYRTKFGSITREGLEYVWPSQEES